MTLMWKRGDLVERELEGMWFSAKVRGHVVYLVRVLDRRRCTTTTDGRMCR